jgi:hypothetical protein
MTGGFNTNVRGIDINIKATLDKYGKKDGIYTRKAFEEYLKNMGLDGEYRNNTGGTTPINNGFVISFEYDNGDDDEARGMLATGSWEYQNWVTQNWSKKALSDQIKFLNKKHMSKKIETNLRKKWSDRLVLSGKFETSSIGCEWSHNFFNSKKNVQNGGYVDDTDDNVSGDDYYTKYMKYKAKYINLKKLIS